MSDSVAMSPAGQAASNKNLVTAPAQSLTGPQVEPAKHLNGQALVPGGRPSQVLPGATIGDFDYATKMQSHLDGLAAQVEALEAMAEGAEATALASKLKGQLNQIHHELSGSPAALGPFDPIRSLLTAEQQISDRAWKSFTKHTKGRTGISVVDGARCEEAGAIDGAGCFLSVEMRTRLMSKIDCAIVIAMENYSMALNSAKNEMLAKTSGDWSFVVDLLLGLASSPMLGLAKKGFMLAKTVIESTGKLSILRGIADVASDIPHFVGAINADYVNTILDATVGEARDQLKGKITPQENGVRDNVAFLSYLKSQASGFALSLSQHGEAQCTDVQLCALLAGYSDVSLHSEANYHEQIVHSLNRFNASHIADISKTSGLGAAFHRTTQCVVVKAGDQQRRAMVMVTQRADSGAARTEEIAEQFRQDQVNFLSWVDDDLAELADSVTASRIGDVVVVDILHMGMSGPLGEWAVRSAKQQMQTKKKAQV